MQFSTGTPPDRDLTTDFDYRRLVAEEIEEYDGIEVTEDLREGGIHSLATWRAWFEFLNAEVFSRSFPDQVVACCQLLSRPARILSLGCGYGGMEIDIARRLRRAGVQFSMVGLDLNEHLFSQVQSVVERDELPITFKAVDLNFVNLLPNSFDLVFAHASVHHVLNLEHLFAELHKGLSADGWFIIHDLIGQAQVLFWRENVDVARQLVTDVLEELGLDSTENNLVPPYVEPSAQVGMEGIRQEEILEVLAPFFEPIVLHRFGAFVRMLCTNPTFDAVFDLVRTDHRDRLSRLFLLDLELVRSGQLRPTEMFGVFLKRHQE